MTRELPPFVHDLLANPPRAGKGVHAWLFKCARQLHAHYPATQIASLLENAVANCGRHVSQSEIQDAVKNSIACAWQPGQRIGPAPRPASKWPVVNREQREAIIRDNGGLADLWELSKPRIEDSESHCEEIIDRLFPGNPLLCCGRSNSIFATRPREDWRGGLSRLALIVPSPMTTPTGLTKEGKESAHTLSNTGPRRFLICEFDQGTADDHAALLIHLGSYAPLACAVHSGGKSLHGWFYIQDQPEDKVRKFFQYAVSIGADPATWTRSQFVRMPDGTRENGNRQTVFFLNFKPMES